MKLLLTSILLCFTIHLLLSQSFTNNIWPCSHSNQDCDSILSAYDEFNALQSLSIKKDEIKLNKRNDFLFKLDSSYTWKLVNNNEVPTLKAEYIYDKIVDSELILIYDNQSTDVSWVPESYFLTTFNKRDLLTIQSFSYWDGSENYNHNNASALWLYTYDDNNRLIISETQDAYDVAINRVGVRNVYHYDSLGFATGISRYFHYDNVDTITHTNEIKYNYNDNEQLESIVARIYDQQVGWIADDSIHFTYDNLGNIIEEFEYIWNGEEAFGFRPFTENYYFYDNKNQVIDKTHKFLYDKENNSFKYESFFEYTYHEYGSLQQEVNFISDFYDPRQVQSETSYSHYTDILTENTLRPRQGPLNDINLHNEKYVLNINERYNVREYGYRDLDFRTQSFYSEIDPVSTTNPVISDSDFLKVSPNPTSDFINFDWTDYSGELNITLYNITGQKVRSLESINKSAVDLTTLDSGVYFYTVGAGDRVVSGRVVRL